jgi:hypothetical protein
MVSCLRLYYKHCRANVVDEDRLFVFFRRLGVRARWVDPDPIGSGSKIFDLSGRGPKIFISPGPGPGP